MPFFLARTSPQRRTDSLGFYQLVAFALKTLTLVLFSYLVKHADSLPIWKYQWLYVFLLPSHAA